MTTDIAKTCPECGPASRLVVRENGKTHEKFLGCPNYPTCKYTEEMGIDQQLRAQGAAELPGLEGQLLWPPVATGINLDNLFALSGIEREDGEADDAYRARAFPIMQAKMKEATQ